MPYGDQGFESGLVLSGSDLREKADPVKIIPDVFLIKLIFYFFFQQVNTNDILTVISLWSKNTAEKLSFRSDIMLTKPLT